jgi:hypothetical protein
MFKLLTIILCAFWGTIIGFYPAGAKDYSYSERGGDVFINVKGSNYKLIPQTRLNEVGFKDASRWGNNAVEGLGDSASSLGCVYTLGMWRSSAEVERFAIQGFVSRRLPGVASLSFKGKDFGAVTVIGDQSALAITAFVPNSIMAELEKVAVESKTGMFRDLKVILLMERRREECSSRRDFIVIDYIPLDKGFDAAPFIRDATDKGVLAYDLCRRFRRCP